MKNKWLNRSLLEFGYYTLCLTEKQYQKVLKHLNVPACNAPSFLHNPYADASVHHFERDGKLSHVVCLGSCDGKDEDQVLALLVHEAVHLWQEFKDHIGETSPGRESEAYAIQRLSQSLIGEYLRQTKRNKGK